MPSRFRRRAAVGVLACSLVAVSCSGTSSQADNVIAADVESDEPDVVVLPGPTALPTTETIDVPVTPLPTPLTLRGGEGIVVPTPDPNATEEPDDADTDGSTYNEAAAAGTSPSPAATPPSSNEAAAAGTTPAPSPVPTPTAVPTPADGVTLGPTLGPEPSPTLSPADATEVSATNGGEVFTLNCARCHSENGLGTSQAAGLIGVGSRYTQSSMVDTLTNGHAVTFGFSTTLTPQEIADVAAYVISTFP
ncbi:MAG: c-type cytochrome [Actinomycetota bacterium]